MSNTPDIDIRPDHWEIVRDILQKHVPQYEVWAFGSRAKWTAKEFSDLDLAIITDEPLPEEVSTALNEAFEESDLPYKVDVVEWASINEEFKMVISKQKTIVKYRKNIATGWEQRCLGDVADLFDGPHATPKKAMAGKVFLGISSLNNGRLDLSSPEYISDADYKKWTKRVTPRSGDIVFSYETRLGEAAAIPAGLECCLGRRLGLLRPQKEKIDSTFLLYLYLSPEFQNILKARTIPGSTVDRISLLEMPDFPITVPTLSLQRAIAHILGTLDDKIELTRRMNETLESMARAIFKDWFVDFGPVRAKAEGRQPEGMNAELVAVFPDIIIDLQSREIPFGWQYVPLSRVVQINPKERLSKGEIAPYLEMSDISTNTSWTSSPHPRAFTAGMKFRNGDTLLARITPCLENGKTAFIQNLPDNNTVAWGSTEFIVMRAINPVPAEYCYLLAREESFRNYAIGSMTGSSGRQRASAEALAEYPVVQPPESVWAYFKLLIHPLFQAVAANSLQIQALAQLRDTLLPKLISGELRIKDAEKFVEQAV